MNAFRFPVNRLFKFIDVGLVFGGDKNARRRRRKFHPEIILHLLQRIILQRPFRQIVIVFLVKRVIVYFVENIKLRLFILCDFADCLLNHLHLLQKVGMRNVRYVKQNVSLSDLVQG